jgi:hypothetical protein
MNKLIFIFLCFRITLSLYTQDIANLEIEYTELLKDIKAYGPQATIPFYTNTEYYDSADGYIVDVDNDFVFAIIGSGFLKFIDTQGNVRYTRYLWLNKNPEGYFFGLHGICADEFFETDNDGFFSVTAYLPKSETRINRERATIEMDDVIPVERMVVSRKLNTSMINLVYTVNRMVEILYILEQYHLEPIHLYKFKIRTLETILNYIIQDRYEFERESKNRFLNNQQITQRDFYEMHPYLQSIFDMLPFLELER